MIRTAILSGLAGLCAALWIYGAPIQIALWPLPPYDPHRLGLDEILFVYGHVPRGFVAIVAGAMLGLSGALLQTVLRNPIADPSTLGISSGAQLALVSATILAPELLMYGRWPIAMTGAMIALCVVLAVGTFRAFHPVTMVIVGMLVSLLCSSTATALTLAQGQYLFSLIVWTGGSLVQTGWGSAMSLLLLLALGLLAAMVLHRPLTVMGLGAEAAGALGVQVAVYRLLALILAAILAASVAASVGLVAFVGLAAPAFARALGARRSGQIMALAPITGALLLWLTDGIVLMAAGIGGELFPTGAATGLIGGPLILILLMRMGTTPPPQETPALVRLDRSSPVLLSMTVSLCILTLLFLAIGRVSEGWLLLDWDSLVAFLPNRLPRLLGAATAGGLLALAGTVLQRITGNALASPEVLGISGGAAIGYAATVFFVSAPTALALTAGATAGGIVTLSVVTAFVLAAGARPEKLLLAGVAISSLAGALLSIIMAAGTSESFAVLAWLSGSASAVTGMGAIGLLVALVISFVGCAMLWRWLAILPFGPDLSRSLGLAVPGSHATMVAIAGLATAIATIVVGPLSFVGLMAPHIARHLGLMRPHDHLAGAVLIGAFLMLIADFLARTATFPYDLPLGLVASLLGTPWLLWLMFRRPA